MGEGFDASCFCFRNPPFRPRLPRTTGGCEGILLQVFHRQVVLGNLVNPRRRSMPVRLDPWEKFFPCLCRLLDVSVLGVLPVLVVPMPLHFRTCPSRQDPQDQSVQHQREDHLKQEEVDPEGQAAWPTYQEEEPPRLEDTRRFYLPGPLLTRVLSCELTHMDEVEHVVQHNCVGNPRQSGQVLLDARSNPIHL